MDKTAQESLSFAHRKEVKMVLLGKIGHSVEQWRFKVNEGLKLS